MQGLISVAALGYESGVGLILMATFLHVEFAFPNGEKRI